MTQHTNTLRELTHQLFDGLISAEEYRRAVAPTHPHPHGALPSPHATEMVEAIRRVGPNKPDVIGIVCSCDCHKHVDGHMIVPLDVPHCEYCRGGK